MSQRLFITATDTGVGKTVTTIGLACLLSRQGVGVRAIKPVASGGVPSEDTLALAQATGQTAEDTTRWSFYEPAAPPVAARAEGRSLDLSEIVRWIQDWEPAEVLLVEGVGGLLCPLTESATVADLIAELGYPVLIVARRSLGTLNHTLLTVESALWRGLDVRGVLLNETQTPTTLAEATAPEELRKRLKIPILGVSAFCPEANSQRWADNLAALNLPAALGWNLDWKQ